MATHAVTCDVKQKLMQVADDLSEEQTRQVLDFALFIKARQSTQGPGTTGEQQPSLQPLQRLEDLWGDFWPEGESVDDFIAAVRTWRQEDAALHRELQ